jgi:ATP-dependent Clp protease ATP-binding subunit ClpA
MFERFGKDSRAVVVQARHIAVESGSPTVEAEHLLLALTEAQPTAGLDRDTVRDALDAEQRLSLAVVGISEAGFDLPSPAPPATEPQWGTSAKSALQRAARVAARRKQRRIEPRHLLLAVLEARAGTIPRALEIAGLDRLELARQVDASFG